MKKYNGYKILAIIWTASNFVVATGFFMGFIYEHCGAMATILYALITYVCFVAYYEAVVVRKNYKPYNEKG